MSAQPEESHDLGFESDYTKRWDIFWDTWPLWAMGLFIALTIFIYFNSPKWTYDGKTTFPSEKECLRKLVASQRVDVRIYPDCVIYEPR